MTEGTAMRFDQPAFGLRRRTMSTDVRDVLREMIVLGEIPSGSPVRLGQIARELNVSVSPVREALRQLEAIGLVEHIPYKGARVTPLSASDMQDVYDVRLELESIGVRKVAARFDDETGRRLEDVLTQLEAAYQVGDRAGIVYGNTAFHLRLAEASGSRSLALALRPILEASQRYSAAAIASADRSATHKVEADDHRAIVDACRAKDPDRAESAIRSHLAAFSERILARFGPSASETAPEGDGCSS
jgi:DNA-binding GntR family transcriptional regulator